MLDWNRSHTLAENSSPSPNEDRTSDSSVVIVQNSTPLFRLTTGPEHGYQEEGETSIGLGVNVPD